MKNKKETNKKFYPTRSQAEYITTYFDTKPKVARKWVELDHYFAKKFAQERYLLETPEKIYIEKLLVEKDKSYHVWGKFFEKSNMIIQNTSQFNTRLLRYPENKQNFIDGYGDIS